VKISLLTDAPKHNLALMKLSAYHKLLGHEVLLNMPLFPADYTYASVLFEKNKKAFRADEFGGPAFDYNELKYCHNWKMPDYDLYPHNDFSLGYTFRSCYRNCSFCKVPYIENDPTHYSIWDFHNPKFTKIELLNNNTFFDPQWKETFEEIWDAGLTVKEHGFDLRLLNDEKVDALKRTKFDGQIHYAWDKMQDEKKILEGLKIAPKGTVYVLIGYDSSERQDIYRVQKIVDAGFDPYIMPYNQTKDEKAFKRFIDSFMWRKYKTIKEAWRDYR